MGIVGAVPDSNIYETSHHEYKELDARDASAYGGVGKSGEVPVEVVIGRKPDLGVTKKKKETASDPHPAIDQISIARYRSRPESRFSGPRDASMHSRIH